MSRAAAIETESLYAGRAELYDAIYHFKRYDAEADRIHELLQQRGVEHGAALIEAACGTGGHLQHLRRWYQVTGFDRSDSMLAQARRKLPDVSLFRAEMEAFALERTFDGLLCLFSSIAYLQGPEQLEAAARCFAAALRPKGVLIIEPFVAADKFVPGRPMLPTYDGEQLKCCRACVPSLDGDRAILDFHWLVLRSGRPAVEHFVERHALWLCPHELMVDLLEQAGFAVTLEPDGLMADRPVLIGERR